MCNLAQCVRVVRLGHHLKSMHRLAVMENPLVTVIIPSYNHATYIGAAIDSVIHQTYQNIQLIVIDDGSGDGSVELIARLAAQHGFHFEAQANIGLSRTLNKALGLAQGQYICTFGSDDIMLLDKIEKQVRFMEQHPHIAACGGNQLVIDSDGIVVAKRQAFRRYTELDFDDLFVDRKPVIPASSAMIRKSVIDAEGGYDPDIKLEDLYLWLKLTSKGYKIACLNDVLIYYRKHASNSYKNIAYMLDSMLKIYALYQKHPKYEMVLNRYLISAFLRASKQNRQLAMSILRQIAPRSYNVKVLRGLCYLLLPKH